MIMQAVIPFRQSTKGAIIDGDTAFLSLSNFFTLFEYRGTDSALYVRA